MHAAGVQIEGTRSTADDIREKGLLEPLEGEAGIDVRFDAITRSPMENNNYILNTSVLKQIENTTFIFLEEKKKDEKKEIEHSQV